MGSEVKLELLADREGFDRIGEEWDRFALEVECPSPFHSAAWLDERWRAGAHGLVVVARRDGELVGALPLARFRRRGAVVGEFLAGSYAGLDVMLRAGEPLALASRLLRAAVGAPLDYLELSGFGPDTAIGRLVPRKRCIRLDGAPRLAMPDGWDAAYRNATSSKARSAHRRKLRRLEEQGAVEFRVGRTPAEIGPILEEAFRLHDLRWVSRLDRDLSNFSTSREFHRRAAERLAQRDLVRIVLLLLDGQAIAFTYVFVYGGTVFLHRLAFDPVFERWSPGHLATLHTVEVAAADGATRVAFLRGHEQYKLELADDVDDFLWTASFSSGSRGALLAWARRCELGARQTLKGSQLLRRVRDRRQPQAALAEA